MQEHLRFLGVKVRDRVTGFTGVATSTCFDLYGCVQTIVQPEVDEKSVVPDSRWFDNNRLEIVGDRVMDLPNFALELKDRDQRGPADKPSMEQLPTR